MKAGHIDGAVFRITLLTQRTTREVLTPMSGPKDCFSRVGLRLQRLNCSAPQVAPLLLKTDDNIGSRAADDTFHHSPPDTHGTA